MTSVLLSESIIEKIRISTKILKAVDHRFRQRMLEQMELYGSLNPEALANILNTKPSLIAEHLDILRREGVIDYHLEGRQYFYTLNYNTIQKINNFIRSLNEVKND